MQTANQIPEKGYTIEIYNVTDTHGNVSNFLTTTFNGYRNPNLKSDFFKISRVEPVTRNMVNVYFTHPVNANSEIASNYEIFEGENSFASGSRQDITVSTMTSVNNGVTVYLKTKTFVKDTEYNLKISGRLLSAYGVNLNEGEEESIKFKGVDIPQEADFRIIEVAALSSNRISIEFSREVDPGFSQKYLNYEVYPVAGQAGFTIPVTKAVLGGEGAKKGRVVYLNLMYSLERSKQYKVRMEFVMDNLRQNQLEGAEYAFNAVYPTTSQLGLNQVVAEDRSTVTVRFNRELDSSTAANRYYYSIKGITDTAFYAMPEKVYYEESDGQYVVRMYLPYDKQLNGSHRYKLTVLKTVKDSLGESPLKDLEYTFTGSSSDKVKPYINRAAIISKDAIKVEFSREIAAELPNLLISNYTLEYLDGGIKVLKVPSSMVYVDSRTLILKFDALDYYTEYTLKFDELKDLSGMYTRTAADGQNSVKVSIGG